MASRRSTGQVETNVPRRSSERPRCGSIEATTVGLLLGAHEPATTYCAEAEANAASHGRLPTGALRLVGHAIATLTRLPPFKIAPDFTLTGRPVDLTADGDDLGIVLPFMLPTNLAVPRLL
ncbi:hypothetical protein LMG28727_05290 [Paraburkholderia kirstenboschensis]|nr:hypothetical protein LMG28727_05290 [Paraburkholderia kirstenboschensis]